MRKYFSILALSLGITFSVVYAKQKIVNIDKEIMPYEQVIEKMKDKKSYGKPHKVEAEHVVGQDDSDCPLDHSEDTFTVKGENYTVYRMWGMDEVDFNLNGREIHSVRSSRILSSIYLSRTETRLMSRKRKGHFVYEILKEEGDKMASPGIAEETNKFKKFVKDVSDALETAVSYAEPFAQEKLKTSKK